jgi:hypothetical protein
MTRNEHDEAIRAGLLRALAMVQRYQKKNGRLLQVSEVCRDITRLIRKEAALSELHIGKNFPRRLSSSPDISHLR